LDVSIFRNAEARKEGGTIGVVEFELVVVITLEVTTLLVINIKIVTKEALFDLVIFAPKRRPCDVSLSLLTLCTYVSFKVDNL